MLWLIELARPCMSEVMYAIMKRQYEKDFKFC